MSGRDFFTRHRAGFPSVDGCQSLPSVWQRWDGPWAGRPDLRGYRVVKTTCPEGKKTCETAPPLW